MNRAKVTTQRRLAPIGTLAVGLMCWTASSSAKLPPGCQPGSRGTYFADVTGDGRADAIVVNTEGIVVRRSNGGQFLPNQVWSSIPYFGNIDTSFADVNGDGKADAIVVNSGNVTVRLSSGHDFGLPNQSWTVDPYFGTRGTFFSDVNADGRADAIEVAEADVRVRTSNGSVFVPEQRWTTSPYFGNFGTYFADVDGDGAADAIAVNAGLGVAVRRAYFISEFPAPQFLPTEFWTAQPLIGVFGDYFADVTGDAMADAILVDGTSLQVLPSNGDEFVSGGFSSTPFAVGIGTYFADVTGDGVADAIAVNPSGVTVRPSLETEFGEVEPWTSGPYFGDIYPVCIN